MLAKNRLNGNQREKRGSILIACLIILSVLTIYGAVLVSAVYERSLHVTTELDRLQAFYLAEAGIAKSIQEVKSMSDRNSDGLGTIPKTKLGRGTFQAIHDPGTLSITGIGEVNGVQRRIRIYYEGV